MAEAFLEFHHAVTGPDKQVYRARVCGRLMEPVEDGRWEGWIEFEPEGTDGAAAVRTPRETVQPKRSDLEYWGTGLTPVYLEGALARALEGERLVHVTVPAPPVFDGPAPSPHTVLVETPAVAHPAHPAAPAIAVLDPFSVYLKGEAVLRQELSALAAWHLRNIVKAYALEDDDGPPAEALGVPELIERIVAGVRRRSP